jgi:hypothetical protein
MNFDVNQLQNALNISVKFVFYKVVDPFPLPDSTTEIEYRIGTQSSNSLNSTVLMLIRELSNGTCIACSSERCTNNYELLHVDCALENTLKVLQTLNATHAFPLRLLSTMLRIQDINAYVLMENMDFLG